MDLSSICNPFSISFYICNDGRLGRPDHGHCFKGGLSCVSDLVINLIIRAVLLIPALLIFDLCVFYFYKVRSHLYSVDPMDFSLSHTHQSELGLDNLSFWTQSLFPTSLFWDGQSCVYLIFFFLHLS